MLDVLIIGAGPAGLFAADRLSAQGHAVTIVDRMPSPARKFLMAGRGGLNITHSEPLETFVHRYREAEAFLRPMIEDFPPSSLQEWCHGLGQETFIGTSGRIFPKAMKASPLLRVWLRRLETQGVQLLTRQTFLGFADDGAIRLQDGNGEKRLVSARTVLLALGGASWPKLGSNGAWADALKAHGVVTHDFQPANSGFQVRWSDHFKDRFAGHPLKRIRLSLGKTSVSGEAMLSRQGLEGGAVYALSAEIREAIRQDSTCQLGLDLRPAIPLDALAEKLTRPKGKQSWSTYLKKVVNLNPAEQALVREAGPFPERPEDLAPRIKAVPILCDAPYSIDRAISSAGGIALTEVDEQMMLKRLPGVFVAGEMLDWEAPTGGYLLQACFATSFRAAQGIANYLTETQAGGERT